MAIAVEPNGNYGGVLGNQKYSPLTLASATTYAQANRAADAPIYAGLLVNRRKLLADRGMLAGPLSLAVADWPAMIIAEMGKNPPLVVISSNRSEWIADGIANGKVKASTLPTGEFTGVTDFNALDLGDLKRDNDAMKVSPPLYAPERLGPDPKRSVYVVVHMLEYETYKEALEPLGITVVGFSFKKPRRINGAAVDKVQVSGFGAARYGAISFCKELRARVIEAEASAVAAARAAATAAAGAGAATAAKAGAEAAVAAKAAAAAGAPAAAAAGAAAGDAAVVAAAAAAAAAGAEAAARAAARAAAGAVAAAAAGATAAAVAGAGAAAAAKHWDYAWLLDDNIVALEGFPGLAVVEAALKAANADAVAAREEPNIAAGFEGGTAAAPFADIKALGRRQVQQAAALPALAAPTQPPGLLQQAVLWNIDNMSTRNLNFGFTYVTSGEDLSFCNLCRSNRANNERAPIPYLWYGGISVRKELPAFDDNTEASKRFAAMRLDLVRSIVKAESRTPDPPVAAPPPVMVKAANKAEKTVQALVIEDVLNQEQRQNADTQKRASCQAVEQLTCGALGRTDFDYVGDAARAATFSTAGDKAIAIERRSVP